MRKTEKGRQRDIQTERQKMKEREREDTFSKPVFFSLINTLVFLPFIGVISSNSIAHFVINENVVLQINFNIFGYKLNTVSIICCRNRLLLQVTCCNRLTKKTSKTAILIADTVGDSYQWNLDLSIYTPSAFRLLLIVDGNDDTFVNTVINPPPFHHFYS